jgi:hypothetical protein
MTANAQASLLQALPCNHPVAAKHMLLCQQLTEKTRINEIYLLQFSLTI